MRLSLLCWFACLARGQDEIVSEADALQKHVPLYTLTVSMTQGRQALLKLWSGQEPADAVACFSLDHYATADAATRATAEKTLLEHLCSRFPCARSQGRRILFPLDLDLPGSAGRETLHVHEGDDAVEFGERMARRHGFLGMPLQEQLVQVIQGELDRRAAVEKAQASVSVESPPEPEAAATDPQQHAAPQHDAEHHTRSAGHVKYLAMPGPLYYYS